MLGRIIRVLFGFIVACLAVGVATVAFVMTPAELASLPLEIAGDRIASGALWALAAATHSAIFSAPFALLTVAIGEWRGISSWTYYTFAAIVISLIGFLAQYSTEAEAQSWSIVNNYALTAFLTAGFIGGFVYWMLAGRSAGSHPQAGAGQPPRVAMRPTTPTPAAGRK